MTSTADTEHEVIVVGGRCAGGVSGTHSQTTIDDYFGVVAERAHEAATVHHVDHPKVLVGGDNGPTPVDYVLHASAGYFTAGLVNIAAARGIALDEVTSTVEGDIDLNGIIGLDDSVRNGCDDIRVTFTISSDAPADKLRDLFEQSRARSAVFDIITNSVPVSIEVDTGVPPEER